jgi:hypothetical protein
MRNTVRDDLPELAQRLDAFLTRQTRADGK